MSNQKRQQRVRLTADYDHDISSDVLVAAIAEKSRAHRRMIQRSGGNWSLATALAYHDDFVREIAAVLCAESEAFRAQEFYQACGMREPGTQSTEDGVGSIRQVPFYGEARQALLKQGWATLWIDSALDERTATMVRGRPIRPNAIPKEGK